jgi:LPS export ABC transporter protein LptC
MLFGLLILVAGPAFALCLGCSNSTENASARPETIDVEPGAFGKIADFTFTRTTGDRVEFELAAKSAVYFEQGNKADFEKADITFFAKDRSKVNMTCDGGTVRTDTKDIEAKGNVVIRSSRGFTATTDSLSYNANEHRVFTDAPVTVQGETFVLVGEGFSMSLEDQTMELTQSVKATFTR